MRLSRLRILLLTLLLAIITLWITNQQTKQDSSDKVSSGKPLAYSWQAIDTTIWKISAQEPNQQTIIHAENMHYKDKIKLSEFSQPNVTLIDNNTVTTLTSVKGKSIDDQLITFEDKVVLTQSEALPTSVKAQKLDITKQPTILKTNSLTYNSKTNQLLTDANISISQYNGVTTGKGLRADLTKSEYKLLSNVKGIYYPSKMQTSQQNHQIKGQ
ncbi:MAG TPA: LPS export ABC transporter periplasmic protein LptC [Thiomicrospira sp.]|jgi:lipopolysaccharide export system protein LptC|nr:LPS export ABC transporter periplasmic protein LptC [Thiomicrospira sp.]